MEEDPDCRFQMYHMYFPKESNHLFIYFLKKIPNFFNLLFFFSEFKKNSEIDKIIEMFYLVIEKRIAELDIVNLRFFLIHKTTF